MDVKDTEVVNGNGVAGGRSLSSISLLDDVEIVLRFAEMPSEITRGFGGGLYSRKKCWN